MDATEIVYISAEVIVGLITVIGNCLVLAAIVKTQRLHTITNVFVGNLAIADIAVGLLVAPCAALSFMGLPNNFYGCVFINCLILMFTNVSILMLLSVAIERFIAIKEPFLYHRLLTVRRAIVVNVCVWILGSVLGLMPMYGWHGGYRKVDYCRFTEVVTYQYMVYFQFFGLILLPLFIMLCIYIYILIIVRKHLRQTNALQNRFNNQTNDGFSKDVRAAKMFALVILLFGIFWFPVNIFNCVSLYCGSGCTFPRQALLVAIVMSHANSSINPFLYATSNSRIKGAIKELFGIKLKPEERSSTDHNNIRHATHGTPRARENAVAPIYNADDRPNSKGEAQSNEASYEEIRSGIVKMQAAHKDNPQEGENDIILNNMKQVMNNNDIRQSLNLNIHSDNQTPLTSNISLSSLARANILSEVETSLTQHPQHNEHQCLQSNNRSCQEFVRPSITPPSSVDHTQHSHTHTPGHYHDHCNLAFVNGESLSNKDEDSINETSYDRLENNKDGILHENDTDTNSKRQEKLRSKHDNLWCWQSSGFQDIYDTDHDTVEPAVIYQQLPNGHRHSLSLKEHKILNSSIDSNEISVINMSKGSTLLGTTLSSLSGQRTLSREKLELSESVEEYTNYNGSIEINTDNNVKNHALVKSYILANEYGILTNVKTEHTKL